MSRPEAKMNVSLSHPSGVEPNALICVALTLLFIPLFAAVLLPQYLLWLVTSRVRTVIGRAERQGRPRLRLAE
jgi:hypothetical protein